MLVRLSLFDPRMLIRLAFYPAAQCQISRDMHFRKKGVSNYITRVISNKYIYIHF